MGAFDEFNAVLFLADVTRNDRGFPARIPDPALSLTGVVFFVEIRDQYVGTLARICYRDGSPDSAVASSDERHSALQPSITLIAMFPMVSLGAQFLVGTRWLGMLLGEWWLVASLSRINLGFKSVYLTSSPLPFIRLIIYFFGPLVLFFLAVGRFLELPAPLCAPAAAGPAPPRWELPPPAPDSAPLLNGMTFS